MTKPWERWVDAGPVVQKPAHADHVILNIKTARLECTHCGATFGLSLPMKLTALSKLAANFEDAHRACERKAGAA